MARRSMLALLEALVQINCIYIENDPSLPTLYEAGIRYDRTTPPPGSACGDDDWQDMIVCLRRRIADCEDLSCYRVADLRMRFGVKAKPYVALRVSPGRMGVNNHEYHIQVEWPKGLRSYPSTVFEKDGRILEDPSVLLGMNAPRGW